MSEPARKEENLQHNIWCLITNTWAYRVAIVKSVITRYLTLAKAGWSNFRFSSVREQLSSCSWTIAFSSSLFFVAASLLIIYLLLFVTYFACCFVFVFDHSAQLFWIQFCFIQIFNIWLLCVIFVLILEMCSRYFNPHPSGKSINITHKTSACFCLSIGSKSLFSIIDIRGISGSNFSVWFEEGKTLAIEPS